jgi:hypothetical protein
MNSGAGLNETPSAGRGIVAEAMLQQGFVSLVMRVRRFPVSTPLDGINYASYTVCPEIHARGPTQKGCRYVEAGQAILAR